MKQRLTWKREKSTLMAGYNEGEGDAQTYNTIARFDLSNLFADFKDFNVVQRHVVVYGVKQKLADSCARLQDQRLTFTEMAAQMDEVWEMLKGGEWTKKKTPATPLEKAESKVAELTGMIDNAVKQAADLGITEKQAKDLAMKLFGDSLKDAQKKVKELSKDK